MKEAVIKFFTNLGYKVHEQEFTICFTLEGINNACLQFFYFIKDQDLHCCVTTEIMSKDIFDCFRIDKIEQVEFVVNNARIIRNFNNQLLQEKVPVHAEPQLAPLMD